MTDTPVPETTEPKVVTDPALIAKLNAMAGPTPPATTTQLGPQVTDPAVLDRLNKASPLPDMEQWHAPFSQPMPDATAPSSLLGAARGVAKLPGVAGDLYNLGEIGLGKFFDLSPAMQRIGEQGKRGLEGGNPIGSAGLSKLYDELGLFSKPTTPDGGDYGAGETTGSLVGSLFNPFGPEVGVPKLAEAFKAAHVTPRIAADMSNDQGLLSKLPTWLSKQYGAQGIVKDAAEETQDELTAYGKRILSGQPTQALGDTFGAAVPKAISGLKSGIEDTWAALHAAIPQDVQFATSNTSQAFNDLDRVQNVRLREALGDGPITKRFSSVFGNNEAPLMQWDDLDVLRRKLGELGASSDPETSSAARKLYAGISEDMRTAAATVPDGSAGWQEALQSVKDRQRALDDILSSAETRNNEMLPGFLTQQAKQGDTRLSDIAKFVRPEDMEELGRWMLRQKSMDSTGEFSADKLYAASQPNNLPPTTQTTLFGVPTLRPTSALNPRLWQFDMTTQAPLARDLERFRALYEATQPSRDIATAAPTAAPVSNLRTLTASTLGGAIGHVATGDAGIGALIGAGASKTVPMVNALAAKAAVGPMGRFLGNPSFGSTPGLMKSIEGATPTLLDQYFTQQHAPQPAPDQKHSEYLGDPAVPLADKVAFAASKLGPQIGSQLNTGSPEGDGAALTLAMLNPQFRSQLS